MRSLLVDETTILDEIPLRVQTSLLDERTFAQPRAAARRWPILSATFECAASPLLHIRRIRALPHGPSLAGRSILFPFPMEVTATGAVSPPLHTVTRGSFVGNVRNRRTGGVLLRQTETSKKRVDERYQNCDIDKVLITSSQCELKGIRITTRR